MDDQIAMSILEAEEAAAVVASSSTQRPHLTFGLMFLNLQSDLIEYVWNKFHWLNEPFYLIIM
jgi:hypothetical protein